MNIKIIQYNEAAKFAKGEKSIFLNKQYIYFGLYDKETLLSILSISEKNDVVMFHSNFTPLPLRGKGYFTALLSAVSKTYKDKIQMANCLESSKNIYLKLGFELKNIRHYTNHNLYKVVKRNGKR